MNARDFKMPFGKYKGETLEEIYVEDVGYLDWLAADMMQNGCDEEDLYQKIQQCFKEMRNVRICK